MSDDATDVRNESGENGDNGDDKSQRLLSESIKTIGGLIAVIVGVLVVASIAGGAITKNTQIAATIAASASGAVATMVGAYFGVKVGSDQTKTALDAAKEASKTKDKEAAKAQVYALHVPADNAGKVETAAAAAAQAAAR
jgi:hypothetical protein